MCGREIEERLAVVCGELNAAHGRLVAIVTDVLDSGCWQGQGLRSVEHWVAWQTGLSPARAAQVVAIARRSPELPTVTGALAGGELAVDQVAVVVSRTPAWADVEVCQLARQATVTQLRRVVGRYPFDSAGDGSAVDAEGPVSVAPVAPTRCSFGVDDGGRFRLQAEGDQVGGAVIEAALGEARDRLFHDGLVDVSWWDALVDVAHRSLDRVTDPARRERFKTYLHLDVDRVDQGAFTGGWALPDAIRRYLTCDGTIQPVWQRDYLPFGVGRTTRIISERTRRIVRHRDRGCRVPGCQASRWLDIHHITHWEHGGATETSNLVCLCPAHHRLHHQGRLGIAGDADDADGLSFTNHHGLPIPTGPRPRPPTGPPEPANRYRHPSGEPLHLHWVYFNRPRAA